MSLGPAFWFLILTLLVTRGELRRDNTVPLYSMDVPTVPLFNAWTIGWNAVQLREGFSAYWQAPIFHPEADAFAFSEPQPATMLVAPIVWLTGSVVPAYRTWLMMSLFLNGMVTSRLLKNRGYRTLLQLAGGSAMLLLPIIHGRIDVLQLVPVWGVLLFWDSVFRMAENPQLKTGAWTGFCFALCFALCTHHGLFLSLLMVPCSVVFWPLFRSGRFSAASFMSLSVAAVLIAPIVIPLNRAAKEHEFQRDEDLVARLSATPAQFLNSPPNSLIHFERFQGSAARQFCVGWIRLLLGAVGISGLLFAGHRSRWTLFLSLMSISAFAFSLGLNLELFGWKPWKWLIDSVPGFAMVRSVFRFAWFFQMAVVLLAVEGSSILSQIIKRLIGERTSYGCLVICCLLLSSETIPQTPKRGGAPNVAANQGWITFLRNNTANNRGVACLPMPEGSDVAAYSDTVRWMIYGLKHRVPIVNGYSGFFPKRHTQAQRIVNGTFPSVDALKLLVEFRLQFLVVRRAYCEPNRILPLSTNDLSIRHVFEDPCGVDIYEIIRNEKERPTENQ